MFSAKATDLWSWAGVPRKGWGARMLYQRWITESRQQEVIEFWNAVSKPQNNQPREYLVGPTALTVAIYDDPVIDDGQLVLTYERPFNDDDSDSDKLAACAKIVVDRMRPRLTGEELVLLEDPAKRSEDALQYNYFLQSLCEIKDMSDDSEKFIQDNEMTQDAIASLVTSLEALCRPALIVDGQHRLYGAANSESDPIYLPVVAIPNSPWMEQIYQFVVINEKAKKVESSLLTDIFGSSLTPSEQVVIRAQLAVAGASIEPRIAAVIAGRESESPFFNMVKVQLEGDPPGGTPGFISEATIRQLIDGGSGGALGWRSDDEFYEFYVRPTFEERPVWEKWNDGRWRDYWFAFWSEVRDWYNAEAAKAKEPPLWHAKISNLTKAVSLRLFQRLFMEEAIKRVKGVLVSRDALVEALGEDQAEQTLTEMVERYAIPDNVDDFATSVRSWFLTDGVPVRVFLYPWVTSLDVSSGQDALMQEFREAFEASRDPKRKYRAQNAKVFTTPDK